MITIRQKIGSPVCSTCSNGGATCEMIVSERIKNIEAPAANVYKNALYEIMSELAEIDCFEPRRRQKISTQITREQKDLDHAIFCRHLRDSKIMSDCRLSRELSHVRTKKNTFSQLIVNVRRRFFAAKKRSCFLSFFWPCKSERRRKQRTQQEEMAHEFWL